MPGTGNKKASCSKSSNSSEKLFLGASAEGSARDVSITTPQTPLAASLFCPRAASGAASACFQGWGPVLVGTSHTLKRGPHTGHAHTRSRKVTTDPQGAVRLVCCYCCARLVCAGRVLLPLHTCIYYADIIRCCTTTPSPPSPSPTSAAVLDIVLGGGCARWLVVQSSQGARGEESLPPS